VGARLSTGNKNDPGSPYVSFGSLFEDFDIFVDRAYLKYSPNFWQGLYAIGGKHGPKWISEYGSVYKWDHSKFADWIEKAAKAAGR